MYFQEMKNYSNRPGNEKKKNKQTNKQIKNKTKQNKNKNKPAHYFQHICDKYQRTQ